MKAFIIQEPFKAGIYEVETPVPKSNEVLIKVIAAGFCGTDVHTFKGEHPTTYPIIPGHEFSGIIAEIGSEVKAFNVGDPVTADPNIFCEECYFCKQNKQIHCENIQVIGNTRNGAFAEYVTVPEKCVFPAPDADLVHMAMAEPLACVINGHNKIEIPIGGNVLIFGAGTIGLMHVMMARRRGAATVTIVDLKQEQLDIAKNLGANHALVSTPEVESQLRLISPRGFSTIIDATGVPKVVEFAITLLADTGTFLAFGACPIESSIKINPYELFYRDLKLIGSYALEKTMQQSISMLAAGKLDLGPLIGRTISIDDMPKVFDDFVHGRTNNKILVKFD